MSCFSLLNFSPPASLSTQRTLKSKISSLIYMFSPNLELRIPFIYGKEIVERPSCDYMHLCKDIMSVTRTATKTLPLQFIELCSVIGDIFLWGMITEDAYCISM